MNKLLLVSTLFASMQFTHAEWPQDLSATVAYGSSDLEFDIGLESRFNGVTVGISSNPKQSSGYWATFEYAENSKSDSKYYEGTVGLHYNLFQDEKFYVNGLAGLGFTRIESGITSSDLNFISVPLGLEMGYSWSKNVDVFASVGYKWLFDRTGSDGYFGDGRSSASGNNTDPNKYPEQVLCNDGSWHDGNATNLCNGLGGAMTEEKGKVLCNDGTWGLNNSNACLLHDGVLEGKQGSLTSLKSNYGHSVSFGDADATTYKVGLRFKF